MKTKNLKGQHLLFFVIALCNTTQAEIPLSLENIVLSQSETRVGFSLSYYNQNHKKTDSVSPLYLQTPQNSVIAIPGEVHHGKYNSDTLVSTFTLNHGVNDYFEVYGNASALWQQTRYEGATGNYYKNHYDLSELNLGLNYTFAHDGKNPALIGTVEGSIYQRIAGQNTYGKSFYVGVTTYKAIDPIVYSLSGGYRFNLETKNGIKTGNQWMFNPTISFAANDQTTLSAGLRWVGKSPDSYKGVKQGQFSTNTWLNLGVGHALNDQTSIHADIQWNSAGDGGSSAMLSLSHRF